MGGRSSRIVSYDEACDRLGSEAVGLVEEGFRRLCTRPRGLAPMDAATFRRDVLGDLPQMVRCAVAELRNIGLPWHGLELKHLLLLFPHFALTRLCCAPVFHSRRSFKRCCLTRLTLKAMEN